MWGKVMKALRNSVMAVTIAFASLAAMSAHAASYLWSFTDLASQLVASGTLTTGAVTIVNISGPQMVAPVTSLDGSLTGIDGFTAENVSLFGTYTTPPSYFLTPSGIQTYDNAVFGAVPYIDGNGLEVLGATSGGLVNIYNSINTGGYAPGNYPNQDIIWNETGNVVGGTFNIASVPEPTTWAMFVLGAGLLGGVMRLRRRSAAVANAA
jgi:hypothetical protein